MLKVLHFHIHDMKGKPGAVLSPATDLFAMWFKVSDDRYSIFANEHATSFDFFFTELPEEYNITICTNQPAISFLRVPILQILQMLSI